MNKIDRDRKKNQKKTKDGRNSKWRIIINRCFEKGPKDSQREFLEAMNAWLKINSQLSKKQAITLVRIARSLKAYYPDKKHESLTQKLIRVSAEKNNSGFKIKNIGGFIGLRKKEQQ